jgi:hypothetical protein
VSAKGSNRRLPLTFLVAIANGICRGPMTEQEHARGAARRLAAGCSAQ